MLKNGQRKIVAFLASLVAAFILLLVTVLRCPEHISPMGIALTEVFGVLIGLLVAGNIGEHWTKKSGPPSPGGSSP